MPSNRTHYDILGVPEEATLAQIKRRYKRLVHKYHPDVAVDKELAHKLFIEFTEAYVVLSDPARRRAYDTNLNINQAREAERAASWNERSDPLAESVVRLLQEAQYAFIHRKFSEAADLAGRAIALDPRCGRAYVILGDVRRVQGKLSEAVEAYGFALQNNPADKETKKKLMELVSKYLTKDPKPQVAKDVVPKAHLALNIILLGAAALLLYMIMLHPGVPVGFLKIYAPPAALWSVNLAGFIAGASVLIGLTLSVNGLLANPDEELLYEGGSNWAVVPTGMALLMGSGFFFLGAAAFYLLVGFAQSSLSKSVLTVFACVTAVVLISAIMYKEPAIKQVLLFGGNVSFIPMLIGWHIGAAFRPLNE